MRWTNRDAGKIRSTRWEFKRLGQIVVFDNIDGRGEILTIYWA